MRTRGLYLGMMAVLVAVLGTMIYRADRAVESARAAEEWLMRCGRIYLTMPKEEVVLLMGNPSAERREADGRILLEFAHPAFDPAPRAWLDARRNRVDEVRCNRVVAARMTPQKWQEVDAYEAYRRRLAQENELIQETPELEEP